MSASNDTAKRSQDVERDSEFDGAVQRFVYACNEMSLSTSGPTIAYEGATYDDAQVDIRVRIADEWLEVVAVNLYFLQKTAYRSIGDHEVQRWYDRTVQGAVHLARRRWERGKVNLVFQRVQTQLPDLIELVDQGPFFGADRNVELRFSDGRVVTGSFDVNELRDAAREQAQAATSTHFVDAQLRHSNVIETYYEKAVVNAIIAIGKRGLEGNAR